MITDRDMMLDELADEMFPMLLELISDRNFYDTYIKKAIIEELGGKECIVKFVVNVVEQKYMMIQISVHCA